MSVGTPAALSRAYLFLDVAAARNDARLAEGKPRMPMRGELRQEVFSQDPSARANRRPPLICSHSIARIVDSHDAAR